MRLVGGLMMWAGGIVFGLAAPEAVSLPESLWVLGAVFMIVGTVILSRAR